MRTFLRPALVLARVQFMRLLRDPVGVIILFGLPMILLIVFGAFLGNTDGLTLDVAFVDDSNHAFAPEIERSLQATGVFDLVENRLPLAQAQERLRSGDLDAVVHLPEGFGDATPGFEGVPGGTINLSVDETRGQTADIARSILESVILQVNRELTGVEMPIQLQQQSVLGDRATPVSVVFALFSALGLLMMGVFGAASTIPMDRKTGALRRLHAMPFSSGQLLLGTMLSFGMLTVVLLTAMTLTAVLAFGMLLPESLALYTGFLLVAIVMVLGLGFAISGIAKTPSQADVYGQIVFFGSLALGGIWVPQAFMPEILRTVSKGIPLTPVIDGMQLILHGSPSLVDLLPQIAVIVAWIGITYTVGLKTFRWE